MRQLKVRYLGWGEDWPLGRLAQKDRTLVFEYSPEALARGLELSPRHLKLKPGLQGPFPLHLDHLPGLFSDALPDGWGRLLMDRWFRKAGAEATPLERLAFLGDRAMGAFAFEPVASPPWPESQEGLLPWALAAQALVKGAAEDALPTLLALGGSPQGARPKVLVNHDPSTGHITSDPLGPGKPWLVKFQANGEHKEVCAVEAWYATLATACGLPFPDFACFDLSPSLAAFGVARFDREGDFRVPVHSLAGLLHLDFRLPSIDYGNLLRATRFLTKDQREVEAAFSRAVFNALFHNRDDHPKNLAFRLGKDGHWRLAPPFDLTYSEGPAGQHHVDFAGEASRPTRKHLLEVARYGGLDLKRAEALLDEPLELAGRYAALGQAWPIRKATLKAMTSRVEAMRVALAHS